MVFVPEQAAILCGGRGTRLRPITDRLPKPMVPVNGVPFLEYLLVQLRGNGIREVILMTGYLGQQIQEYFGDGNSLQLRLRYSHGPVEWDTGRRLYEIKPWLSDCFMLLYADNFAQVSLKKLARLHEEQGKLLTFTVQPKSSGNIRLAGDGAVEVYDKTRSAENLGFVELGYMIASKKIFEYYGEIDVSFSDIIAKLVSAKLVAAMIVGDAYHSVSDPDRLKLTEEYLKPKKILMIDRDGVINRKAPRGEYIASWNEFSFLRENVRGMKKLSEAGYSFIVISNQAGIARRMVTKDAVDAIHQRMRQTLEGEGIPVLDVYVCPHHWKENCLCRKPQPGLFFQASREWLFRLDKAYFVGDDPRDCQAAYRAGCGCVYIGSKDELKDLSPEEQPQWVVNNLEDAVPYLVKP
ncbi:MAG: HAD-IIIA family hydrolase [Desulfomonile tiedjei]|nr:HAD-IIIA family hydrolase [Desulfomonile tiedjei]